MQHPDEGTIHAWLDGELPEDQANEIAAHASDCPECSAMVAEARGLIAASTRILTLLDDIPAGVIPEEAVRLPAPARRRRWYNRTDIRAAAALLVVAGASFLVVQRDSGARRETLMVADKIQPAPAPPADRAVMEPPVAAQQAVGGAAPVTGINKAMPKTTITTGETQAPPASRADAAVTVPPVAEPMRAASPPALTSVFGAVKVTSKRGKLGDSTSSLREGSVAGAARAVEPAFGVVEGRVIDQSNDKGLASANVILSGTSLAATTDKDGRFSITKVPVGEQHITVRRIGYQAQNIALAVPNDASVTANVVLTPSITTLSEAVFTGVATRRNIAGPSLRVLSVDSTKATRRTVYEVSQGVRVTLAETSVEARKEENDLSTQLKKRSAAATQRTADASDEKAADSAGATGVPGATVQSSAQATAKAAQSMMAVAASAPVINTISWTDRGRRYVLSGPLTTDELQALKARLMLMRR